MATKKQVEALEARIRQLEAELATQAADLTAELELAVPKDEAKDLFRLLAPLARTKGQVMALARIMSGM